jgi:hypothetical protein
VDAISFSSEPIPQPGTLGLTVLDGVVVWVAILYPSHDVATDC